MNPHDLVSPPAILYQENTKAHWMIANGIWPIKYRKIMGTLWCKETEEVG